MLATQTYTHAIEVVEFDSERVVKTLHARSEREADMIDNGVTRQLNHERYFTRIVPLAKARGMTHE